MNNYGKSEIKIVILQRGWVFVGRFNQSKEKCMLTDSYNVRNWGTTKGIGQLAVAPTKDTLLDPSGTVSFHELSVIALVDCSDAWIEKLKIQELGK